MSPRGARVMRGAAVAAFATLVASVAHTVGGGTPPGPLALVLSLAFSVPIAMVLVGQRMTPARASASALAAQAALHLLYALGTGSPGHPASVGPHAAHAATAPSVEFAAFTVEHGHATVMPLAHVVAAALTVAMLALFQQAASAVGLAFGTLVHGVRLLASVLRGLPVPTLPGVARPAIRADAPPNPALLILSPLRHRGPPRVSLAA
ncbi:hypothetical protein ACFQ58_05205 [Agromyces sp. NPDC056523]|uniref:hypothetical protein n=1 Tax=Agromyces sp. NPDC056523 TaxID=3345850 RepID=UPI00367115FC